ncbi:uncharacterized protein RHOBADRAFT_42912 [Rhodotorula graminis WP1]|uniref:Uncharacterized protein n=1 Tax=Rhodotorula graminis (strain WP1) TaxID=578459 RepID=A0A194S7V5_RHOGW|nr:uncharacterized protein RHOBADRAFT_42912 [Rhodotorula graminis WP1]KPV76570.1 hypothetical protein RHOBADRAFT_42912 [Rhodotorula graminis WP1]
MPRNDPVDDEQHRLRRPAVGERDTRRPHVVASHQDPFHQARMPAHLRNTLDKAGTRKGQNDKDEFTEAMNPHWERYADGRRADARRHKEIVEDHEHDQRVLDGLGDLDPTHEHGAGYDSDESGVFGEGVRPPIIRERERPCRESGIFGDDEPQIRQPAPAPSSSRPQESPVSPRTERKRLRDLFRRKNSTSGDARSLAKGGGRRYRAGEVGTTSDSDSDY